MESFELTVRGHLPTKKDFEAGPATGPEGNACFFLLGYLVGSAARCRVLGLGPRFQVSGEKKCAD